MNLEQEFEKETGAKAYTDNNLAPKIYSDYFVEWLMEKINHKQCSLKLKASFKKGDVVILDEAEEYVVIKQYDNGFVKVGKKKAVGY